MSVPVQNHWFFSCLYCLFRFWTFVLFHGLSCRHHSQENPNEIWINVQGCFVIQLSRFCVVLFFDATSLFYHFQKSLSRTFFILFLLFFNSLYILAFSLENVKNFFCDYIRNGEEGIWTLAPLLTTYSLSRRAPSASWVLLHTINEKTPLKRCAIQCLPDSS